MHSIYVCSMVQASFSIFDIDFGSYNITLWTLKGEELDNTKTS